MMYERLTKVFCQIAQYKYSSGIYIQKECNKQMDKTAKWMSTDWRMWMGGGGMITFVNLKEKEATGKKLLA
jgi:hypothetical protein